MPAKEPVMTSSELVEYGENKKSSSRLYKAESIQINNNTISDVVSRAAGELESNTAHVAMSDVETIRKMAQEYMKSCAITSTVPSISGFTRALGCSRRTFYKVLNSGNPPETAAFFEQVHDLFAEILSETALKGAVQPVVAIFLEKALFGVNEKVELVITPKDNSPFGEQPTQEELERRLAGVVVDDGEDR